MRSIKRKEIIRDSKWFKAGRTVFGRDVAREILAFNERRWYSPLSILITKKQLEQTAKRYYNISARDLAMLVCSGSENTLDTLGFIKVSPRNFRDFYNRNTEVITSILETKVKSFT